MIGSPPFLIFQFFEWTYFTQNERYWTFLETCASDFSKIVRDDRHLKMCKSDSSRVLRNIFIEKMEETGDFGA